MSKLRGPIDDDLLVQAQNLATYFDDDYDEQLGGLIPDVFYEYDTQSGRGFGSIIRGLSTFFRPIGSFIKSGIKSALGTAAKHGAETLGRYVGDLTSGRDWREAGAQHINDVGDLLGTKLREKLKRMEGAGQQYGGNKSLHNAVKLFSFSPQARAVGCVTKQGRRRRRRRTRRRTTTTTIAPKRRTTRRRTVAKGKRKITRRRRRPQRQTGNGYLF